MSTFNQYQWENYLNAGGNEIVKIFDNVINNLNDENYDAYIKTIKELHQCYFPEKTYFIEDLKEGLDDYFEDEKSYSIESGLTAIKEWIIDNEEINDKNYFAIFSDYIELITTSSALLLPELYIPYYFKYCFNVLEYIFETFNIELPPIPAKKDYTNRFFYYGEICASLQNFRQEHNLSIPELWAFIYDYAPKCVGGLQYIHDIKDLPEPRSAFFIGGQDDPQYFKDNDITFWQCNPDTRIGDMIVMYLLSPDSRIGYVWRSVSAGFNDPFFWYYRCCYIAHPQKVKSEALTLKNMKNDSKIKQMPIVKKNMQGVNGIEIPPSIYNHILEQTNSNHIIQISCPEIAESLEIKLEKDVEQKLLEPLLEKLGYSKGDYITQFRVRMGRNEKIIPDYAIFPTYTPGYETAQFIWEAKKTIPNQKQLEIDIPQAVSYARRLKSQGCALVAQEGIWIMTKDDDYKKVVFHCTWNELNNIDTFKRLQNIAGK